MSLFPLLIAIAVIVALRVFIRYCVAYNDFLIALEIFLRDRFDLPACDSMLQNDTVVEYRKKFRLDEKGHFGVASREGFPEVEDYEGGVVG